ncbi:alpha/beta fold hydrolase [Nonomuraea spiralis]|uniref:Alpha/beta fold hydrolase n=1 Tax=Nonomuraea spiralis TaxID=46182 RepID=A0ABV5ICM2_9ACTN|nr:alpha/beta hydrolase [Nonomuraea spiralis]GGS77724.1 lipase [Nonomuraea spiralis]
MGSSRQAFALGLLAGAAAGSARRRTRVAGRGTEGGAAGGAQSVERLGGHHAASHAASLAVETDDGVRLAVDVEEPSTPVRHAVVLAHGWVLNRHSWHYQRAALSGEALVVAYDQRGHGASTAGPYSACTIDRLGADLHAVIEAAVPPGLPVVLAGHSMGGMTVMALAASRPELFGTRIAGVALLGTSAGRLAEGTFGLPGALGRAVPRVTPLVLDRLRARAAPADRSRAPSVRANRPVTRALRAWVNRPVTRALRAWVNRPVTRALRAWVNRPVTRFTAFGPGARADHVRFVNAMVAATPAEVMAGFFHGMMAHDKLAALEALREVETVVLVGARDRLTPVAHARRIAGALPGARLVVIPGAGHMIGLERPETVNRELLGLLRRAVP